MKEKNVAPRSPGGPYVATRTSEGLPQNPHPSLNPPLLNICANKRRRSKKYPDRAENKAAIIAHLRGGARFCEIDRKTGRFRGEILIAMRQLARDYPEYYKLILTGGLWYLLPVVQP